MRTPSLLAAVAGLSLGLACGDSPAEPDPATLPVVWSHVNLGQFPQLQPRDPIRSVIRTQDEWAAFWAQIYPPERTWLPPPPPVAEIDFRREMVVVAVMGSRPTSGYSLHITSLQSRPDHLEVNVQSVDGPRCGNLAVAMWPRAVIRVSPRRDDLRFVEEVIPCRAPP